MKKTYISPTQTVVQMSLETGILALSGNKNHFEVEMSDDEMYGSEALSTDADETWNSEWE